MHLTVGKPFEPIAEIVDIDRAPWAASFLAEPARYGASRRGRTPLMAAIVALHLAGIAALALLHAAPVARPQPRAPLVMQLQPLPVTPDAPAPVQRAAVQPKRVEAAPPAAAAAPADARPAPAVAQPSPVTLAAPAPAPAVALAPAAPAPVAVAAPAPLVPPDGEAATLHNPAPTYPLEARRKHQEGTVRLRVTISAEGRVEAIAVAQSSGVDSLDHAALSAVKRWRFVPGSRGGVPVEAVGTLSIPFKLT